MTCDECMELLSEAVDELLPAGVEGEVRSHVTGCAQCRTVFADLAAIRRTASKLDRHTPSRDVWRQISRRTVDARRSWLPLAAAAAIAIVAAGIYWRTTLQPLPSDNGSPALALSAVAEIQQAERHYEKAIAALEQLTRDRQNVLDPKVNDAIVTSLATIDQAIAESRAALGTDPGSDVAQASLLEALRAKTMLLEETVSLMNPKS